MDWKMDWKAVYLRRLEQGLDTPERMRRSLPYVLEAIRPELEAALQEWDSRSVAPVTTLAPTIPPTWRDVNRSLAEIRKTGAAWITELELGLLVDRVERLQRDLTWALDYIADGSEETPNHECEFSVNPDSGVCNFHERYWRARHRAGLA